MSSGLLSCDRFAKDCWHCLQCTRCRRIRSESSSCCPRRKASKLLFSGCSPPLPPCTSLFSDVFRTIRLSTIPFGYHFSGRNQLGLCCRCIDGRRLPIQRAKFIYSTSGPFTNRLRTYLQYLTYFL